MIVDLRRYTLKPGKLAGYLDRYGRDGYAVQRYHLGAALGWFVADVGPQNHVVQLWGYDSLGAMEQTRKALAADPDWVRVRDDFRGIFAGQETRLMSPAANLPYRAGAQTPGLVDIRIYTLHHGTLPALLAFLRGGAGAVQARHWPDSVAYLTSYAGPQNQIVHIWGHADHAERLARRKALLADPDWQHAMETILPMIQHMETMTATPAPFWTRPANDT